MALPISSVSSLGLSHAKLKETSEKKTVYSASMHEQLELQGVYHTSTFNND
jgi:hypothetical protein